MSTVAVLGAGPAGLMAALTAARGGHDCVVFESAGHVGGMAARVEVAGQKVDLGSHRLHPSTDPAILGLLRDLLGSDLQTRRRNGRIRLRDRWVAFPLRTVDMVSNLPASFSVAAARDTLTRPLRATGPAGTFAEEVTARLGPTVASGFYAPYARKLYGVDAADLDAELARRRVSATSPADIVRRLARAARPAGRTFLYPRGGFGAITDALADAAVAAGVDLRLDAPVEGVRVTDASVAIASAGGELAATTAISTIPVPSLLGVVDPAPPDAILDGAATLRTRAMLLVYLVVDRPVYTEFDAHYLPDPALRVARLSEPKNYRDGDDPPGTTVLCAEIPCWRTDPIWSVSDEDLGTLVADELSALALPSPDHVAVEVRRIGSVYPVYETATAAARDAVGRWLSSGERVISVGRQGLGVIDNTHHVLAMGAAAAGALDAAGRIRPEAWQSALQDFSTHVVED